MCNHIILVGPEEHIQSYKFMFWRENLSLILQQYLDLVVFEFCSLMAFKKSLTLVCLAFFLLVVKGVIATFPFHIRVKIGSLFHLGLSNLKNIQWNFIHLNKHIF